MSDDDFSLISGRQWTQLTKSAFAQVIFHDVQEWYPTDGDVKCCYILSEYMTVCKEDKVGLYRVGWSDPSEYVTFEHALPKQDLSKQFEELSILFSAQNLPKDDGEFYQFCYLTFDNQIRGASTPFKFQRPRDEDLVEIEEESDNDMMLVCSRTTVLDEKLRKANSENINLMTENYELKKANEITKKNVKSLEEELAQCRISNNELKESAKCLKEDALLVQKSQEESSMQKDRTHEKELKNFKDEVGSLHGNIATLEEKLAQVSKERDELKEALKNLESDTILKVQKLLNEEKKNNQRIGELLAKKKEELSTAQYKMADLKNMLDASEESKALQNNEIQALIEFKTKLSCNLEAIQSQSYNYKQELWKCNKSLEASKTQLASANGTIIAMKNDIEDMEKKLEEKDNVLAAKEVQHHDLNEKYVVLNEHFEALQITQSTQEQEIMELREKVCEGATEYESKYLECAKLKKKVGKLEEHCQSLEEKVRNSRKSLVCKSMSSFTHGGSITPGQQTLSALSSMPGMQKPEVPSEMPLDVPETGRSVITVNRSSDGTVSTQDGNRSLRISPKSNKNPIYALAQPPYGAAESTSSRPINRFPSRNSVQCPSCDEQFSAEDDDMTALVDHINEDHNCRMCPMCGLLFNEDQPEQYFMSHVESHFDEENS